MKKAPYISWTILFLLVSALPALGYLDFFSYQGFRQQTWDTAQDTTTRYQLVRLGSMQLETSELYVVPKGSYLDVTEDAWISGNVERTELSDLSNDYLFKGSLPIPDKAAVTGLETWIGNTMYRSQLYPSQYTFDLKYPDLSALRASLNSRVAVLQQLSATNYDATFAKISLGERKHIRIRYVLPNTGAAVAKYVIPVLFHTPNGNTPKNIKITVLANADNLSFTLTTANGVMRINDSTSYTIPYQTSLTLSYATPIGSSIHSTEFAVGAWKGTYILLNSGLTDSIIEKLSKRIETVFIWRWNMPQTFVTTENGIKTVSQDGQNAAGQAAALRTLMETLSKRNHASALIHSIDGQTPVSFKLSSPTDSSLLHIDEYLKQFDQQYLYSAYKNAQQPSPNWIPVGSEAQTISQRTSAEFMSCMKKAMTLFSNKQGVFRHIVLLSAGPIQNVYSIITHNAMDSLLDTSVTCDWANVQWTAIDFNAIMRPFSEQHISQWNGFNFPPFQPVTVQLKIFNENQPYAFPLSVDNPGPYAAVIKSSFTWKDTLHWIGYDPNGVIIGSLTTTPFVFNNTLDSGLVKVWARDENHICENEETNLGIKYGIVTKATFLRAGIGDRFSDSSKMIPFLTDQEVHPPIAVKPKTVKTAAMFFHGYTHGLLSLSIPGESMPHSMEVFDLQGKLIFKTDLQRYHVSKGKFIVPLKNLLGRFADRALLVKLSGNSVQWSFMLLSGGQ